MVRQRSRKTCGSAFKGLCVRSETKPRD